MARAAYKKEDYTPDAEHFTGVDFTTREKEMDARIRPLKHRGQER